VYTKDTRTVSPSIFVYTRTSIFVIIIYYYKLTISAVAEMREKWGLLCPFPSGELGPDHVCTYAHQTELYQGLFCPNNRWIIAQIVLILLLFITPKQYSTHN